MTGRARKGDGGRGENAPADGAGFGVLDPEFVELSPEDEDRAVAVLAELLAAHTETTAKTAIDHRRPAP